MKNRVLNISSALFVFDVIVDPGNTIFKAKVPLLVILLFVLFNRYRASNKFLGLFLAVIFVQLISYLSGRIIDVQPFDAALAIQYTFLFASFVLLLWYEYLDFLRCSYLPSLIISLICIIGYISYLVFPDSALLVMSFSEMNDGFITVGQRSFLGVDFVVFIYRSIAVSIIPASVFLYKFLKEEEHKMRNLCFSVILLFGIFSGGNRTLMLTVVLIIVFDLFIVFRRKPIFKCLLLFFVPFFIYLFINLSIELMSEQEASWENRMGHLEAYIPYLDKYIATIWFGSGAGSEIYSKGAGGVVALIEWTYTEIFRLYGIFGGIVMMYFFLKPLFVLYKRKNSIEYGFPIFAGYLIYLILAGTNPFLISSTGLIIVLTVYSEAFKKNNKILYDENSNFISNI